MLHPALHFLFKFLSATVYYANCTAILLRQLLKEMCIRDRIAAVATDWNDKPRTPVVMEKVEVIG